MTRLKRLGAQTAYSPQNPSHYWHMDRAHFFSSPAAHDPV